MQDINPRVDIAFKKIFGVEENKDLLISLINSIVSKEDQITDLVLLNPYNQKNFSADKLSILDIKAKGVNGRYFNIDIQIADEGDYDKRALYYWAKLYTAQLKKGDNYMKLAKTIGIHILNFTSIPESELYHNIFHIREKNNGFHYFKDLELHTIELKKFMDAVKDDLAHLVEKIKTSLDLWVAFLTKHQLLDKDNLPQNLETNLETKEVKKALQILDELNFTDEEREEYENHHKWLQIQASTVIKAQREAKAEGLLQGKALGIKQGMKEGLKQGLKQGIEQGLKQGIEEVALKMLKAKIPIDDIAKITTLSKDTIAQLMSEVN